MPDRAATHEEVDALATIVILGPRPGEPPAKAEKK